MLMGHHDSLVMCELWEGKNLASHVFNRYVLNEGKNEMISPKQLSPARMAGPAGWAMNTGNLLSALHIVDVLAMAVRKATLGGLYPRSLNVILLTQRHK